MLNNKLNKFYENKIKNISTINNEQKNIFEKKICDLNSFDERNFVLENLFQIQRNSFKDLFKKDNLQSIKEVSPKKIIKKENSISNLIPIKEESTNYNFKFKKIQFTNDDLNKQNIKRRISIKHIQNVTLKNEFNFNNCIIKKYCFRKVKKNHLHNSEDVRRYILKKFPYFTFSIDGPIENSSGNSEQVLKQREYELFYRLEKIGIVYPFVCR